MDTTAKFVGLYREHEYLWNTQLFIYRKKQAREATMRKIVDAINIEDVPAVDVKNKIKNLRSTYIFK